MTIAARLEAAPPKVFNSRSNDLILVFVVLLVYFLDASGLDYWGPTSEQALLYEPRWLGAVLRPISFALQALYIALNAAYFPRAIRRNLPLLAVVGFCALSVLWSSSPGRSAGTFVRLTLLTSTIFLARERHGPEKAVAPLYWIVAVFVAIQYLSLLNPQLSFMTGQHAGRFRGFFKHKNTLGAFFSPAAGIAAWGLWRSDWKPQLRALMGFILASTALFVVMSHSATSLIIVILVTVLTPLALVFRRRFSPGQKLGLIAAGALVVLGIVAAGQLDAILGIFGRDSSFTDRSEIWQFVIRYIHMRPVLGWGYNALDLADLLRTDKRGGAVFVVASAHESYLEIAAGIGLVGLAIYAAFVVSTIVRGAAGQHPSLPFFPVALAYLMTGITESSAGLAPDFCLAFFLLSVPPIVADVRQRRHRQVPDGVIVHDGIALRSMRTGGSNEAFFAGADAGAGRGR